MVQALPVVGGEWGCWALLLWSPERVCLLIVTGRLVRIDASKPSRPAILQHAHQACLLCRQVTPPLPVIPPHETLPSVGKVW